MSAVAILLACLLFVSSSKTNATELKTHVLIVGVEGAGHHTICSLFSGTAHNFSFSMYDPDIFLDGDLPQNDPDVLGQKLAKKWGDKNVIHCADSYPMGKHVVTRHPNASAFMQAHMWIHPKIIHLRRNAYDATLSSLIRFRPSWSVYEELDVTNTMLSVTQKDLANIKNDSVDIHFDKMCMQQHLDIMFKHIGFSRAPFDSQTCVSKIYPLHLFQDSFICTPLNATNSILNLTYYDYANTGNMHSTLNVLIFVALKHHLHVQFPKDTFNEGLHSTCSFMWNAKAKTQRSVHIGPGFLNSMTGPPPHISPLINKMTQRFIGVNAIRLLHVPMTPGNNFSDTVKQIFPNAELKYI